MDSISPTTLSLTLLGGFSARVGGTELVLPTRKARALLAYLAISEGRAESREKLCSLLWHDTRREQAQQSLRQTLFSLRRALPGSAAGLLATHSRSVALDASATWVDVHELERHAAHQDRHGLERVARLYAGPLLDGVSIDEANFDEWLGGERRRLLELAVAALTQLADLQTRDGALDEALQTRLHLVRLDPRAESNHRAILKLYVSQGRRAAALDHYRQLAAGLPHGTGLEPATVALHSDLLSPSSPLPATVTGLRSASLVGRESELGTLFEALERGWAGDGPVAVLTGDAGAGKTRLLDEVEGHVARRGGRVIRGRAFESEQILPFAMWIDALREGGVLSDASLLAELSASQRTELARLSPRGEAPSTDSPSSAPALRLFDGVTALLAALSARAKIALFFDDLQWADEMSLRLLAYVARHSSSSRLFVAATARREELSRAPFLPTLLRELTREARSLDIEVRPLSEEDTAALVRVLSEGRGEPPDARLSARIWRVSEGNPFVIVETLRAITGGAALGEDMEHLPVPDRVREVVTAHTGRLSPLDRELTELAAVIGREFDLKLMAAASGYDDVTVAGAIERLVRAYVLRDSGSEFYFTHDRIREVVYSGLLPVKRAVLHASVARALERVRAGDLDAVCDRLALHYGRAGDASAAIRYLVRFAESAARAFGLEDALAALSEATALNERVPAAERKSYAVEIAVRQANCLAYLGRFAEIEPCLTQQEVHLASLSRPDLTAQYHFWMGFNQSLSGSRARATEHIQLSLRAAESAGDANTTQRAHGLMAYECANSGAFRKGIWHGLEATSNPHVAEPEYLALAWMNLGLNYLWVGQHHDALAAFAQSKEVADAAGIARVSSFVSGYSGYTMVQLGDAEKGIATCRRAVELAADPVSTMSAHGSLASALVEGGEPVAALEILPNVVAMCRLFGTKSTESLALLAIAEALLFQGDAEAALAGLEDALSTSREAGNQRNVGRALRVRGEAALAVGALELAAASLTESEALLRETDALYDLGLTLSARAELARARRDETSARRTFDEAEALYVRLRLDAPAARVRAKRDAVPPF